jgi:hypothetical protein
MQLRSYFDMGKIPNLIIQEDGLIFHCYEDCQDIGALCESPRRILTEKGEQLAAKIAAEKTSKPKKFKETVKTKKPVKTKEAKKIFETEKPHRMNPQSKSQNHMNTNSKSTSSEPLKKLNSYTHKEKPQTQYLNSPKTIHGNSKHNEIPKVTHTFEEETSVLEPEQTNRTRAEGDHVTPQTEPQTKDMSNVNKPHPMKEDPHEDSIVAVKSNK